MLGTTPSTHSTACEMILARFSCAAGMPTRNFRTTTGCQIPEWFAEVALDQCVVGSIGCGSNVGSPILIFAPQSLPPYCEK